MRVLLDECLPRRLRNHLPGHLVRTVPEMGWAGLKNGLLLAAMDGHFDVFVTSDKNLPAQQTLTGRSMAFVILVALDNQWETLAPLMPGVEAILPSLCPGDLVGIEA